MAGCETETEEGLRMKEPRVQGLDQTTEAAGTR